MRRWSFSLGALHQEMAQSVSPAPSRGHCIFLRGCPSLVHTLCTPQYRLLSHLHHRAQFQALPDTRISAHPTVVVLRTGCSRRFFAVECSSALGDFHRWPKTFQPSKNLGLPSFFVLLGELLPSFLLHVALEVTRLRFASLSGNFASVEPYVGKKSQEEGAWLCFDGFCGFALRGVDTASTGAP